MGTYCTSRRAGILPPGIRHRSARFATRKMFLIGITFVRTRRNTHTIRYLKTKHQPASRREEEFFDRIFDFLYRNERPNSTTNYAKHNTKRVITLSRNALQTCSRLFNFRNERIKISSRDVRFAFQQRTNQNFVSPRTFRLSAVSDWKRAARRRCLSTFETYVAANIKENARN